MHQGAGITYLFLYFLKPFTVKSFQFLFVDYIFQNKKQKCLNWPKRVIRGKELNVP